MPDKSELVEVAGKQVTISNPDKVFFAGPGYTKRDLVAYYMAVAEGALRGAGGRPMALKRYVNGAEGEYFFQKRAPESRPEWIRTVELAFPSGRTANEIVLDDAAGLVAVDGGIEEDRRDGPVAVTDIQRIVAHEAIAEDLLVRVAFAIGRRCRRRCGGNRSRRRHILCAGA